MQARENALKDWLKDHIKFPEYSLKALTGDASFRRYFRLQSSNNSFIIMDSPPEKENIKNFLLIGSFLHTQGFLVPQIYKSDQDLGFIILEDFGDQQFINNVKNSKSSERLKHYQYALDSLLKMHNIESSALLSINLPVMDRDFYLQELSLFKIWFLHGYMKISCSLEETMMLDRTFDMLIDYLLHIPSVFVHRDFHSRNLMITNDKKLGILDFQDGLLGPITYDLVSLLKDCYLRLTKDEITWCLEYFYRLSTIHNDIVFADFKKAFDFSGLQRHLKVLGIFSRLHLRDKKNNYLKDLPNTLSYITEVLALYEEFEELSCFIKNRVHLSC